MPSYRFYFVDRNDRLIGPAQVLECADDAHALAQATKRQNRYFTVEVWHGQREVGVVLPLQDGDAAAI
jgi:hypothetical protein